MRSFQAGQANRGARPAVIVLGLALLLGGCTSGGDDDETTDLDRAQAKVAAAEQDLADAKDESQKATDAFCTGGTDYVKALDRYGDIITAEAPTVGDVVTGGADLREPREDALAAGQTAQRARQDVADAENALAAADAELAALQASASGVPVEPEEETPSAEPTPLAPVDAINRVKEADADFTATQQGITDETPLDQASQQFNAAVVALEMAWMQLVVQAGCLDDEQRVAAQEAARAYTTALQQQLAAAGYYKLAVDGIYGPGTVQAVQDLQATHGLPTTGTVDKATDAALQAELAAQGAAEATAGLTTTAALQQTLKLAGYWDGPVDGQWTDALTAALMQFQTDLGVPATGAVDAATVAAFEAAIAAAKAPAPSPTEEEPTDEASMDE